MVLLQDATKVMELVILWDEKILQQLFFFYLIFAKFQSVFLHGMIKFNQPRISL